MSELRLRLSDSGVGSVELDGVDISKYVSAVTLYTAAGELNRAEIMLAAHAADIELPADVTVVVPETEEAKKRAKNECPECGEEGADITGMGAERRKYLCAPGCGHEWTGEPFDE